MTALTGHMAGSRDSRCGVGCAAWRSIVGSALAIFICAILPPLVGTFVRGSTTDTRIAELESGLWIAFATLGAASTGGATALVVIYAVAVAVAWTSGSVRLTAEVAGFALLGLIFSVVASSGGSWLRRARSGGAGRQPTAISGVVLVGVLAVLRPLRTRPDVRRALSLRR